MGHRFIIWFLVAGLVSGCGFGLVGGLPTSYIAGSTKGDIATLVFNDDTLTITTQNTSSTGAVLRTINATLNCEAADSTFGARRCKTKAGATCTAGTGSCAASDTPAEGDIVYVWVASSAAIFALPVGEDQLFVGTVAGSCTAQSAGDYLYINHDIGGYELFGIFRIDDAFNAVTRADFKLTGALTSPTVVYSTAVTGGSETYPTPTCTGGIRSVAMGSETHRISLLANGMFVLDKPVGQGGIVGMKTTNAPGLADIAGKTLRGVSFLDNGNPVVTSLAMGAVSGSAVSFSVILGTVGTEALTASSSDTGVVKAVTALTTPMNLTAVPAAGSQAYAGNTLSANYVTPSTVPGLFFLPPFTGSAGTNGVFAGITRYNNKLVMFGVIYNDRSSGSPAVPTSTALPVSGNFVALEL